MSAKTTLLISIATNVALAAGLAYVAQRKAPLQPTLIETPASSATPTVSVHRPLTREVTVTNVSGFDWRQVESEDYRQFIANLRAVGCPEETIKDIILADVNKLYAPKLLALRTPEHEPGYWESENSSARRPNTEKVQEIRTLEKEKKQLIKELLGVDAQEELSKMLGRENNRDRQYSFLPPEKREALRDLLERSSSREREMYAKAGELADGVLQAEIAQIRKERRNEMVALLTPDELEQYDLRNSETAQKLKSGLVGFNQTEDEFKKIFRLRQAYEEQFGTRASRVDKNDLVQMERYQQARKDLEANLRTALGDQRYNEYVRAKDPAYQDVARLAQKFEVTPETTQQLYEMRKSAEAQVKLIRSDANLTEEQKMASLNAIAKETENTVVQTLGDKVFKAYKGSGGSWIQKLNANRRPAAVPKVDLEEFPNVPFVVEPSQ